MKNFILSGLITILLFSSCSDFLNESLQGAYSSSTFFKTPEQALSAINGAYSPLMSSNAGNKLWVFADVASDDAIAGNDGDNPDIGFIDNFNVSPQNGVLQPIWALYYEGITRCNSVLEYIPAIIMADKQKNSILGQAYFLRAYYYFQLTNIFGDIPLILRPTAPDKLNLLKSTRQQVFSQIKSDCNEAITRLDATLAPADYGRASKGAAYALLAKIHLYSQEWALSAQAALEVTKMGYELMPNFKDNFDLAFENNKESIFQIQQQARTASNTNNIWCQWFAPQTIGGYGFNIPTQNLVDQFEKSVDGVFVDPRLDATIVKEGDKWGNKIFFSNWTKTGFTIKKYAVEFSTVKEDTTQGKRLINESDLNINLIRYADVLLVLAEAYNEDNQKDLAAQYLNMVRERAIKSHSAYNTGNLPTDFLAPITIPVIISQDELRTIIRHERRVEFAFELQRYFDIIRYGEAYANDAMKDVPAFSYNKFKFFPIPQSEIDINPNLK